MCVCVCVCADCCDGSDEYASGAKCPVTCKALMETFQSEKAVEIKTMEAGEADRKVIENESADAWQKDQDKKAAIEASVASFKVMLEQQEAMKINEEKIESDERVHLIKANKRDLMKQLGLLELSHEQLGGVILELGKDLDNKDELLALIRRERDALSATLETPLAPAPIEAEEEAFKIRDEERKRETERIEKLIEERRVAREEKERLRKEAEEAAAEEDVPGVGADTPTPAPVEMNTDAPSIEQEDDADLKLPDVEERPVKLLFDDLNAYQDHKRPEAVAAREKHQETNTKLLSEENELRTLDALLSKNYGPERIFYSLRDKCHEAQSGEYTYSLCFFGEAKQSSTRLGSMQEPKEGDTFVEFTGGDKCWNGPQRSLKVTLECGALPAELYAVDEPATCVYTAKLRTPVACDQSNRDRVLSPNNGAALYKPHHVEVEVSATL